MELEGLDRGGDRAGVARQARGPRQLDADRGVMFTATRGPARSGQLDRLGDDWNAWKMFLRFKRALRHPVTRAGPMPRGCRRRPGRSATGVLMKAFSVHRSNEIRDRATRRIGLRGVRLAGPVADRRRSAPPSPLVVDCWSLGPARQAGHPYLSGAHGSTSPSRGARGRGRRDGAVEDRGGQVIHGRTAQAEQPPRPSTGPRRSEIAAASRGAASEPRPGLRHHVAAGRRAPCAPSARRCAHGEDHETGQLPPPAPAPARPAPDHDLHAPRTPQPTSKAFAAGSFGSVPRIDVGAPRRPGSAIRRGIAVDLTIINRLVRVPSSIG